MSDQSKDQPAARLVFTVDEAWLAKRTEAIIEPNLPIVDPHHHLWDKETRYLFDDLRSDVGSGHDIRATVFLQCGSMYRADGDPDFAPVGETEFVNGVAAMSASGQYGDSRLCAGIVGFADLTLGDRVEPVLEAHLRTAGERFRGVRHSTVWHQDASIQTTPMARPRGLMSDQRFREGFARLAPLGLSFDAWLYHTQLPEIIDLARRFPETTIVLDHLGGILGIGPHAGKRDEVFAEWRRDIQELARCGNVVVKLGGLAMRMCGFGFADREMPPSSEELAVAWRLYIETAIAAFGVDRCMFESNFPVDKGSCSYAILWNAFKRLATSASPTEKTALFSGTAARIYRLDIADRRPH
jgi:L-fuconolactonase